MNIFFIVIANWFRRKNAQGKGSKFTFVSIAMLIAEILFVLVAISFFIIKIYTKYNFRE